MGLEPRTLGACPEPKADAQPLSHPGIPKTIFIEIFAKANVYIVKEMLEIGTPGWLSG